MTGKNNITGKDKKKEKKNKIKKQNSRKQNPKKQKGGNNNICNKDINELLTTNKKIYTYNNSGAADGQSLAKSASNLGNSTASNWGSNPGAPPDPSNCIIL